MIVVNRKDGASIFERLKKKTLINVWLESYSIGELWSKNVISRGLSMSDYAEIIALVEGLTEKIFIQDILETAIINSQQQIKYPGKSFSAFKDFRSF